MKSNVDGRNPCPVENEVECLYHETCQVVREGIVVIRNLEVQFANPEISHMLGYTPQEMLDVNVSEFVAEEERQRLHEYTTQQDTSVLYASKFETLLRHRSGRSIPVEISVRRSLYAGERSSFLFIRNIQDRRQMQRLIAEMVKATARVQGQELFDLTAESLKTWLKADVAAVCAIDSPGSLRLLAIAGQERPIVQRFSYLGTAIESTLRERVCLQTGTPLRQPEYLTRKDLCGFLGATITNKDNTPIGIICVHADRPLPSPRYGQELLEIIAARVSLEMERIQRESKLLDQQQRVMRGDRFRALGQMAGGMAHEFNQPLSIIRGIAENLCIAKQRDWPVDSADEIGRLEQVIVQVDRLAGLIDHVRSFSREEERQEVVDVQIADVITSALTICRAQINAHGIMLRDTEVPRHLTTRANPFALEEIMLSLLRNASDAIESQPADLASDERWIEVSVGHDEAQLTIDIRNGGAGIDPEIADLAFEPFFTTKGPDGGAGMGLATSRSLARQFHGDLSIGTDETAHTLVRLTLPLLTKA